MRVSSQIVVVLGLMAVYGCGRKGTVVIAPAPAEKSNNTTVVSDEPSFVAMPAPSEISADSRYDVALGEAMTRLAEGKLSDALAALEKAKTAKDTELVRNEIDQLKQRLEVTKSAERTADDLRIVLKQGRADEAARLATQALIQFGGGELGETFAALKQQADALLLTSQDRSAQVARWQKEAQTATTEKNYRAALIAYDQALAVQPDPQLQLRSDELRKTVNQYDELRHKADQLRRDPFELEAAIRHYQQAATLWDTWQVRNDIDTCMVALQNRRDRIAIADFEVRGAVGIPHAGRVLAEELIAPFRSRYDVVERQQFDRLLAEANIQPVELNDNSESQRELGKIARVRYLVLGSVTPTFGGLIAHARLVDVNSGLVVQTAKVVATNMAQLTQQAPQLAQMLMMTDNERMAYEQGLARTPSVPVIEARDVIPPLLASPRATPPAPIIPFLPRCPDEGGVNFDDFNNLPPVVSGGEPAIGVGFNIAKDHKARLRLTQLSIELGDNLFRRGQFQDALTQFQLALSLNPGQAGIQARIDQCHPHVPTPLPIPTRRRLVVLDFVTPRPSGPVPPGVGPWVADQLAPYFSPAYSVLDRGALYWYMARLGISLRDVILDPMARAYLGQALNARYFIVGTIRHLPAGFEATAHMLDVATNVRVDTATVTARTLQELKCRIPELAQWMQIDPRDRVAIQQLAGPRRQLLDSTISQGEKLAAEGHPRQAVALYRQALTNFPNDVALLALLTETERRADRAEIEATRRSQTEQFQTQRTSFRLQQEQLQKEADTARKAAERQAASVAAAERERQRRGAFDQLVGQARQARDRQQWKQSAQLYESALGLDRNAEVVRELDLVKTRINETDKVKAAELRASQEAELRRQREQEIARLKQQAEQDRRRRDADEQTRKRQKEDRERAEYARLIDNAQSLQINKRFDEAIGLLMQAKRLRPGPEIDEKLSAAYMAKSAASADAQRMAAEKAKKEEQAKAKASPPVVIIPPPVKAQPKPENPPPLPKEQPKSETPPPLPKEKSKTVDPPPIPKQQPKTEAPKSETPKAPTPPPLPKPKVNEPPPAPKSKSPTPPPLPKAKTPTPPSMPKPADKPKGPPAEYTNKMDAGAAAERQSKYSEAERAYRDALKIVPNDKAATNRAEYAKQMDAGTKAMMARKYSDAVKSFEAALKAAPGDRVAALQLQRAKQGK